MRRLFSLSLYTALLAAATIGGWFIWQPPARIAYQWAAWRVGQADTFQEARRELTWFESGDHRPEKLRELMAGWATGNARFDLHLANYAYHPRCGDALREALAVELSLRPEKLERWSHYWRWRARREPSEELRSLLEYLDTAAMAEHTPPLGWRDVLDAQAAYTLLGHRELAVRLKPENLLERHRRLPQHASPRLTVMRPAEPFDDWNGRPIWR